MHSEWSRVHSWCSIYLKSGKNWLSLSALLSTMTLLMLSQPALAHKAQVYGGTGCVQAMDLEGQISSVLNQFAPQRDDTQNLTARVALSLSNENLSVSLKLTDDSGRVALARRYQLHKDDCPDVPALLQLVLEEFLREFPENPWQPAPETQASKPSTSPASTRTLRLGISILSEMNPVGAKLETNAHLQNPLTEHMNWQMGLQLRANLPQDAFEGSYQRIEILFAAGINLEAWQTVWDIQLLGGGYILSGHSFTENRIATAPALELNLGTRWYWKNLSLGPTLSISLLQHQVQVLPENTEQPISVLNLGLTIQYDTI